MRVTKVYTKTGDKGTTSLVGGVKVSKTDIRIEAYGTVDELSSQLGLLASLMKDGADKDFVEDAQRALFTIGAYLATDTAKTPNVPVHAVEAQEVDKMEAEIDRLLAEIPQQTSFVLPGGSHQAAAAHVCRTVCRRAERRMFALNEASPLDAQVLKYINRLSDYLFVLARKLNFIDGMAEKTWDKTCK